MKLLIAIDTFVTENIYQKIVDISQKQPSWWVIQSALTILLFQILRSYFKGFDIASVILVLFWVTWTFAIVKFVDYVLVNIPEIDNACKTLGVVAVILRFFIELDTVNVLGISSDLVFVSLVYFSTCKPPAPPKKKFSTQPALQN